MSLYNNIAESLSSSGLLGSIRSGLNAALGGVTDSATQALGGGNWDHSALIKGLEHMANFSIRGDK